LAVTLAVCFRAALGTAFLSAVRDYIGFTKLNARASCRLKYTACCMQALS